MSTLILMCLFLGSLQMTPYIFRLFGAVAGQEILPLVLGAYVSGVLTYSVYILVISTLSMVYRLGNSRFPSFREVLGIMIFSSILPIIIGVGLGFVAPMFSNFIYNLGTPMVAYYVYNKFLGVERL